MVASAMIPPLHEAATGQGQSRLMRIRLCHVPARAAGLSIGIRPGAPAFGQRQRPAAHPAGQHRQDRHCEPAAMVRVTCLRDRVRTRRCGPWAGRWRVRQDVADIEAAWTAGVTHVSMWW